MLTTPMSQHTIQGIIQNHSENDASGVFDTFLRSVGWDGTQFQSEE